MKVLVIGPNSYLEYEIFERQMKKYDKVTEVIYSYVLQNFSIKFCKDNNITCSKINSKSIYNCDIVLAFFDNKSKFVSSMIQIANTRNIKIDIIYFTSFL